MRFTDILTTASAVANYTGSPTVTAVHLLDAVAILLGTKTMEELGRPRSPLARVPGQGGVAPAVKELAQRWWADLGGDVRAEIDHAGLTRLLAELERMAAADGTAP